MTRILLISGSTHEGSVQTAALRMAARADLPDVEPIRYEGLRDLPAFVPGEQHPPEPVIRLREAVVAADALLFCTPEYAGSLPGSLKNLLDWLVAGGELGGKPAAWLSVLLPGHDDGARDALESALSHGNARLLRACCVRVPVSQAAVDDEGLIIDPQLAVAVQDLLHSLARVLSFPEPKERPSWHAYSSVLPVIQRREWSPYGS
jgi:chromate reductase, NAD(P)H dehydrogenase (quinone)